MKKSMIIFAGLLFAAATAWATVTLNSNQVQSYGVGGSTVETDTVASVRGAYWNYGQQTITLQVQYGTTGANGFAQGSHAGFLTIIVDTPKGSVSVSDGRNNIQLTAAQQSAIISTLKSQQDTVENALINWGIISGTQVAN